MEERQSSVYSSNNSSDSIQTTPSFQINLRDCQTSTFDKSSSTSKVMQAQWLREVDIRDLHPHEVEEIQFENPSFSLFAKEENSLMLGSTTDSVSPEYFEHNNTQGHYVNSSSIHTIPHYRHFNIKFIIKLVAKAFNAFIEPMISVSSTKDNGCPEYLLPFDTLCFSEDIAGKKRFSTNEDTISGRERPHFTPYHSQLAIRSVVQEHENAVDKKYSSMLAIRSVFESQVMPPPISIEDYLLRIQKYSTDDPSIFLVLVIFADRLVRLTFGAFKLTLSTFHRFCIAGTAIIAKLTSDSFYTNKHYAKVGGIPLKELNQLEISLLGLMEWNLIVNENLLLQVFRHLFLCNRINT